MTIDKELVMYSRTMGCPMISLAKRVLDEHGVTYREVMIDLDNTARQRLLDWVGYLSVPTLLVADSGDDIPNRVPEPIDKSKSPRGINRGTMITEPNVLQLVNWLRQHEFIEPQEVTG